MRDPRAVPTARRDRFLSGSLRSLAADPARFTARLALERGGLARFRVFHRVIHVIARPDLARHVLATRQAIYRKSFHYRPLALLIGDGLITSDGETWRRQRRLAQPAFRTDAASGWSDSVVRSVDDWLRAWRDAPADGARIDVAAEMQRLALGIAGRAVLGAELDGRNAAGAAIVADAVARGMPYVARRQRRLLPGPPWLPTPDNAAFRRRMRRVDGVLAELLASRRAAPGDAARGAAGAGQGRGGCPHRTAADLLDRLRGAADPDTGEGFSAAELRDQALTLLVAGYETVATSLTWTWQLLAAHPDAERRLHEEVDGVLAGRLPAPQDLARLPWALQVAREAMRLYPPVYNLGRRNTEPDVLDGYRFPAGSVFLVSVFGLHRHPDHWADPERFDPERFAPGRPEPDPYAYLPFGAGPRKCIGWTHGLEELHLLVASIAARFRLVADRQPASAAGASVTLAPRGGVPMRLVPRR